MMDKKDAIEYLLYMKHDVQAGSPVDIAIDTAIEALKQSTIEQEVRHGNWAKSASDELYCPYCSYVPQWDDDKYCANCGAQMDGGADNG